MSVARAIAVNPTANGDGTHASLTLMSNGVIFPENGVICPLNSANDALAPSGSSDWSVARFYSILNTGPTPTIGIANGEIGKDIKVYNWSLTDPKGHVLDGWGRVHPFGNSPAAPKLTEQLTWGPGLQVPGSSPQGRYEARALRVNSAGTAGYVLHMFGKPYRCGNVALTPLVTSYTDFSGGGGYDFLRDFAVQFVSSTVVRGISLSADGGLYLWHAGDSAWLAVQKNGSHFTGGWDIMRALEFDFGTSTGYVMHGFGKLYLCGTGTTTGGPAAVGPYKDGFKVKGGPNKDGEDAYVDFSWPAPPTKFFVSLDNAGIATQWNQFTAPALVFTNPVDPLTLTSRPTISVTYGVGQTPAPGPMTSVEIWIYPLAVTQQAGFMQDQGAGAVFTYFRSGITGVNAGGTFSVTMADDLADATEYVVYIKATSTEGTDSGWVSKGFNTVFTKPTTPVLTGVAQPNNPGDPRNSLTITNTTGTFIYEFSSDGGTTWVPLAGAAPTTATTVYDYDAAPKRAYQYRAFKQTVTPYMKSNASNVVSLTMGLATGLTGWRIKRPGVAGATVNLRIDAWAESLIQPQGKYYPAGQDKAVVLTAGSKGDELHASMWCTTQAVKDSLADLLDDGSVLLLQNPEDQWYVLPGETVDFELQKTAPTVTIYKCTADFTEVLRPLV